MKNCILITNEFPYFSGEPFLSNELPYLCKVFQNVYIFAINAQNGDKITRNVPDNVKVYPLGGLHSKLKYLVFLLKGLMTHNKALSTKGKSLKQRLVCFYAKGRAYDVYSRVYKIIKSEKIDADDSVIYGFWFTYQAIAAWLLKDKFIKEGKTAKAVARAHGYDLYWERTSVGYLPYQDVSLQRLDMVYPCSAQGSEYLKEKYPELVGKITVSKLGTVDYGLQPFDGERVLATCCNLEPLKRMPLFAEAFCKVSKQIPDCKWVCIGSGSDEAIVKKIISEAGLEKQVEMLGRTANDKVLEHYKSNPVTFFCNVSTSEGLPVSVMEALSFGIPVIATDVGGTSELVNSQNGRLLDADITADKLAEVLIEMLSQSSEDYKKMRQSARECWQNEVSASKNYRDFCDAIIKL